MRQTHRCDVCMYVQCTYIYCLPMCEIMCVNYELSMSGIVCESVCVLGLGRGVAAVNQGRGKAGKTDSMDEGFLVDQAELSHFIKP